MAKKKKGGKKGKRNSSASVKQSRPAANKSVRNTAKPKTTKKGGYKGRRNSGGFFANPLALLKGIDLPTAAGVGVGVVSAKVTEIVAPQATVGWTGVLVKGGAAIAVAYFAGKSKFGGGVALGMAGVAIYEGINKLTNNAVDNFINTTAQRFAPAQLAPANGNGMGRMGNLRGYPQFVRV